eukprot:CAMPEP_0117758824 /NCGR_PEP_ID=MMETSP0947-20121206/15635_1 /TAXON_ID=44440 /ORGANISM="Chattonella subsalsa, Strain CCMP2191" /LENGTH=393 /DNA_ID=CAMNT_0005579139 /DNA_START=251 /DNA_END=1432 /DNA_ORIENTATION=-
MASDKFNRKGFKDTKKSVEDMMVQEFKSELVEKLAQPTTTELQKGDVTVVLAEKYGFCWGVERAIAMTFEAAEHFEGKTIHITNDLIHNPQVNEKLKEKGVGVLPVVDGVKRFDDVKEQDVVILPAFGASYEEMQLLDKKGVQMVDTTCPWVTKVWNVVDKQVKQGFTTVIHGKYAHEETIATASFADTYLIVKDLNEAEYVCNYIINGGDKAEFLEKFKNAMSEGFDPDHDLAKVGLANQTTMYKKETRAIGQMLQKTMMRAFGPDKIGETYLEFDTICDATQERQDAVTELTADDSLDFILVVGGWDSSNTAHLLEIPIHAGKKAYHVDRSDRILPDGSIEHRTVDGEIVVTENFLPEGPFRMGVTSGASTPDAYVQDCLDAIFLLKTLKQ